MLAHELPPWFIRALAFVFGALWGSFLNVAIYRWPRDMSVVSPPSHCPHCKTPIQAWRNVPIFGFIALKGKTACCGEKLTGRYALVELIGAVLCLAIAEQFIVRAPIDATMASVALETLLYFIFACGLVVATFVDLEWMEIPDEVSLPGAALGLATAPLRVGPGLESALLGAGGAYLVIQLLFVWTYERLFGRRGMGEGDSKLLLMIGAFLGWQGAAFAIFAGSLQGVLATLITTLTGAQLGPKRSVDDPVKPEDIFLDPGFAVALDETSRPIVKSDALVEDQPLTLVLFEGTAHVRVTVDDQVAADSDGDAASAGAAEAEDTVDIPEATSASNADDESGPAKIPFGPFLALAALEYLFFGEVIIEWYLGLFGP